MFFDFYPDFFSVPPTNVTETTLIDSSYFTQTDPAYWDGSYIYIWHNPNIVSAKCLKGAMTLHEVQGIVRDEIIF